MPRPIVGVIGNSHMITDTYHVHAAGYFSSQAVAHVAQCTPLIVPTDPDLVSVADLLDSCDGFLFTGGRPNVHPEEYGEAATPAHGEFDRGRDRICLELIRELVTRGQPMLGVCRGFQEINVAFGGTLDAEVGELPGRMNHRMPLDGALGDIFALRQRVTFAAEGPFARLLGTRQVMTNTLHGQGIRDAGDGIVIDGVADDGTPEALYVRDAPGFALSVQWHPEFQAKDDPVSTKIFTAFGDAVRAWAARDRSLPLRAVS